MPKTDEKELSLTWSNRLSLRHRIFAVNIFALAILAGSIFYLDSFRSRLTQARLTQVAAETRIIAETLSLAPAEIRTPLLARLSERTQLRLRLYARSGARLADSRPGEELADPDEEPIGPRVGRAIDTVFDAIVRARRPERFDPPSDDRLSSWPEAAAALGAADPVTRARRAPDGTLYISAAARIDAPDAPILLVTTNARDIREIVWGERLTLALILAVTILFSALLSRFLARTVANPLRRLAYAAHRVRLGRAREVAVPRLPARRDEIGLLARALHDMTLSLRTRIDATESFAADVTHELKNPLASLRSAIDSLERVEDPELRRQLTDLVRKDVARLDRLVVEIAEASRLDAELSRAKFEPVDLGALTASLLPMWQTRAEARGAEVAFEPLANGSMAILGDEARLARLLDNIVDNAVSFSPEGGRVAIEALTEGGDVLLSVEDDGPGVPEDAREDVFRRFHSVRPEEDFGRHSGLGLSIARAIAEAHDGEIKAEERPGGRSGARFAIRFPRVGK